VVEALACRYLFSKRGMMADHRSNPVFLCGVAPAVVEIVVAQDTAGD
jgi:hypothetical protein